MNSLVRLFFISLVSASLAISLPGNPDYLFPFTSPGLAVREAGEGLNALNPGANILPGSQTLRRLQQTTFEAVPDEYDTATQTTLAVATAGGVLSNDIYPVEVAVSANLASGPAHAAAFGLNSDGSFSYTPNPDYAGLDSFTYTAYYDPGTGLVTSNTAMVTITVNDPPAAANYSYSTNKDANLVVSVADGLLKGTPDPNSGQALTAQAVDTSAVVGTLVVNPNGSFTYQPTAGYTGAFSFTYRINDGFADSNPGTVSIKVNNPPVAAGTAYTTPMGTQLVVTNPNLRNLVTDTDNLIADLSLSVVTPAQHGTVVLSPDGPFTYTPTNTWHGADSFTYRAFDGTGYSNTATVNIFTNALPSASDHEYSIPYNSALAVSSTEMRSFVTDDDPSQTLTFYLASNVNHGVLLLAPDGHFTYTPTHNVSGVDSFTYFVNDGIVNSNTATITIRVNTPPFAASYSYGTTVRTTLNIPAPGLLLDSTDPDPGQPRLARLVTGIPANIGTLTINENGSFTYIPAADYNGIFTFTYKIFDGLDDSNVATVTIKVNDPPVAPDMDYVVSTNTNLNIPLKNLIKDLDTGEVITTIIESGPSHGTLQPQLDGSYIYTPTTGYYGPDSFQYHANDGTIDSNSATIRINVNYPPFALSQTYYMPWNTTLTRPANGLFDLVTDLDRASETITISILTRPANGVLTQLPDKSFTYTPNSGFSGTDSFTYRANDGFVDSNTGTVTIRVNYPPVAANQVYSTNFNTPLSVPVPGVMSGMLNRETNETLTVVLDSGIPAGTGILNLSTTGAFSYTPANGFEGDASFTYHIFDGYDNSNTATVTISVVNHRPTGIPHEYTTSEETPLSVTALNGLLQGAADIDQGQTLTVQVVSQPAHAAPGGFTLFENGAFSYTPAVDFPSDHQVGKDSFTFVVYDGRLASSPPILVTLNVSPVNDAPITLPDTYTVGLDGALAVGSFDQDRLRPALLEKDYDPEGDPFSIMEGYTQPSYIDPTTGATVPFGTLSDMQPDGSFKFLTDPLDNPPSVTFQYRVKDQIKTPSGFPDDIDKNSQWTTVTINLQPHDDFYDIRFVSPVTNGSVYWVGVETIKLQVKSSTCQPTSHIRFYRWLPEPIKAFEEIGVSGGPTNGCDIFEIEFNTGVLQSTWTEVDATLFDPAEKEIPTSGRQHIFLRRLPWNGPAIRYYLPVMAKNSTGSLPKPAAAR